MKKILITVLALCSVAVAGKRVTFGVTGEGGFGVGSQIGSKAFGGKYNYLGRDSATMGGGGLFGAGATLNISFTDFLGFHTGASYRALFMTTEMVYEGNAIKFQTRDHAVNVPVLLRLLLLDKDAGYSIGAGVQWGFPLGSVAKVNSAGFGIKDRYDDSTFRAERDFGIVVGFGPLVKRANGSVGGVTFKIFIPRTYLDTYNGMTFPGTLSVSADVPIFGF